jgi:hypothetical protein
MIDQTLPKRPAIDTEIALIIDQASPSNLALFFQTLARRRLRVFHRCDIVYKMLNFVIPGWSTR